MYESNRHQLAVRVKLLRVILRVEVSSRLLGLWRYNIHPRVPLSTCSLCSSAHCGFPSAPTSRHPVTPHLPALSDPFLNRSHSTVWYCSCVQTMRGHPPPPPSATASGEWKKQSFFARNKSVGTHAFFHFAHVKSHALGPFGDDSLGVCMWYLAILCQGIPLLDWCQISLPSQSCNKFI